MLLSRAAVTRSICKESFYEFFKEFWPVIVEEDLIENWHLKFLCDELQIVAERVFAGLPKLYDVVINVPPGSTKSTICSQMLNAWIWTRMAHARMIGCSYAKEVALKDGVRTRDIVQSEHYREVFPDVRLRDDTNAKGMFKTTRGGERFSTGVLGVLTGFHGHFLLVDDPLNPEESYSEAMLKTVNRWMKETLPSRKINKIVTPIIIIQQRLAEKDPSGMYLEKKNVRHICLPAETLSGAKVSPPEVLKFYTDGLLDPQRMPLETLKEAEIDLGEYGYASQYLQHPVPLSGGLFKVDKISIHESHPPLVRVYRSWDKAGTKDGGAWSVGVKMGQSKDGRFWVTDVKRGQWDSWERELHMQQTAEEDGVEVIILIEVEGGSGGKESGQSSALNLTGYRVILIHPTGDKEARAYPMASQVGAGNVSVLKRDWTPDYLKELRFFPRGKYKDQVDASSQSFNRLRRKKIKVGGFGSTQRAAEPDAMAA